MFNVLSQQGSANQNYIEIPSYTCQMVKIKITNDSSCWQEYEVEHSAIADGSGKFYNHQKYDGISSEGWKSINFNIQLYILHIPKRLHLTTRTFTQPCSL
jgi:phosphoribosylformylglycinamidine (FGAM) synthase-like amidotransferase family enzyme